jgi:hypothetical protein
MFHADITGLPGGMIYTGLQCHASLLAKGFEFIIRSYKESVSLVKRNQADAVVGIHPAMIQGTIFSKYPFAKDYALALFKKNKIDQWNGPETLKNKKIGWIKGYSFDDYLEVPVIKKEFSKRETILRRLDKDQIDFFLATPLRRCWNSNAILFLRIIKEAKNSKKYLITASPTWSSPEK